MHERRRIETLLVQRAVEGLSGAETRELERLLAANPRSDDYGYERAAAAITLARVDIADKLPAPLRARLAKAAKLAMAKPG